MILWPSCCSTASMSTAISREYDTPRAGNFEPLRFVPKGKTVAAVDSSVSTLEYEYNGKISWKVG